MKIIIPMAGKGTRLRPHTLTTPKSLIQIVGKPIIQRVIENIVESTNKHIQEIAFIVGDVNNIIEDKLENIVKSLDIKVKIYRQSQPLGTAHALLCAKNFFNQEPLIIAFADTLFQANFDLDIQEDGLIWTKEVHNPHYYGVVKCDYKGYITDFLEKPKNFVSNFAMVGIYYIKNGNILKKELQNLIDNNDKKDGEYQLTTALENMKNKGYTFVLKEVKEWMDCGNKNDIIKTNSRILTLETNTPLLTHPKSYIKNSLIIQPCFIGKETNIENSKIGPYVSIGEFTKIKNSNIENSLIQNYTKIIHANLSNSMIGNNTTYIGLTREISLGDYSVLGF